MDTTSAHYLAKARINELHREADHYRLLRQLQPPTPPAPGRLRASVGRGLINMGERLMPRRVAGPAQIGHQLS